MSSIASFTAVNVRIIAIGTIDKIGLIASTIGIKFRIVIKVKYQFDNRLYCSYRFNGMKVNKVYLVVRIELSVNSTSLSDAEFMFGMTFLYFVGLV